jgi:hypothetical protein
MNNTKNILLIALITATLILGTSVIPMQSYADEDKITKDSKSSIKASTEVDKKSASQHQNQDNFCYRGDDCEQANQGQEIVGKDNEANGFNDQSLNVQQDAAATPTTTPTPGNGTTPTPTPTILNICKTVVNQNPLLTFHPSDFTFNFSTPANPSTFQGNNEGCTPVTVAPGTYTFTESVPRVATDFGRNTTGGCEFAGFTTEPEGLIDGSIFNGTIAAGETQTCTITNTILVPPAD